MTKSNNKRKKGSLLSSKRKHSITQTNATKRIPQTLKPLRARQLIRRFHVLIKYKSSIINKLKQNNQGIDETGDKYKIWINKNKNYKNIYETELDKIKRELKINKTPDSVIDPKNNDTINDSMNIEELIKLLGKIDGEIEKRGGLEAYQTASTLGQDGKRGGDSSKILVKWLDELHWEIPHARALEIGCLSSKNEISRSKKFGEIVRIDLHSQEPGIIEEEDFLKREIPKDESDKFNCISCSLVVNFVPNSDLRGDMMCRLIEFLKKPNQDNFSILFFVIPLPCIENSRYFDNDIMDLIWIKLGFEKIKYHQSNKLVYWLLKWKGEKYVDYNFSLKKREIRKGNDRNNFCITIK